MAPCQFSSFQKNGLRLLIATALQYQLAMTGRFLHIVLSGPLVFNPDQDLVMRPAQRVPRCSTFFSDISLRSQIVILKKCMIDLYFKRLLIFIGKVYD
jgi:hypothetical protein